MSQTFPSLESGHGVPVVTTGDEHSFSLDEAALERLLLRPDVRERSAVVLSVAGAFRKGKSFLLDFMLRYMHHKYALGRTTGDWLGEENEPLKGFSWRGGSERDTTGILLWSQPFFATLDNGEEVVILIMDTQGTFDSESTVKDNATVFALSTMLSSVQIYNISQNIEEDDLQHLQLFSDYGRVASDSSSAGAPFQRLQLLVRDWSYPYEHPYGASGGDTLLRKRLEVHEGQHEQLQALRRHINSCFEEVACFLMPHPGMKVATNPEFNGKLADIDPEFKSALQQFIPMLLAPQNLVLKRINGQKVKAKDLMLYFKSYMNIFNGSELPEPKSILAATAEANNLSAVAHARDVYDTLMEEVCGGSKPYLGPQKLVNEHARALDKALLAFRSQKKMGGKELAEQYCERLEKEIEEQFEQIRAHNESKTLFRVCGTAAILGAAAAVALVAAAAAAAAGLGYVASVANSIAVVAIVMLAIWIYSRLTGNLRDIALQLDAFAESSRDLIFNKCGTHTATGQHQ